MNEQTTASKYDYKAFISYSHAADGKLAPAVQMALRRFGKAWYSPSSIQIFRDETGLALTPDLWGEIQERLEQSECFILLASPQAAQSQWVEKEIQFWLEHRSASPLLIVLTGGELKWGEDDFDWNKTDALPRSLQQRFKSEPLWANLSWVRTDTDLSLRSPRFFVEIAKMVASMRQEPLEKVFDEAAVRHQKAKRLLWAAVAASVVLTVIAVGAALVSFKAKQISERFAAEEKAKLDKATDLKWQAEQARRAEQEAQRKAADSAQLAAKAAAALPEDRELSMLLALEAVRMAPTRQAEHALRQTLLDLVPPLVLRGHADEVFTATFSGDGRRVLTSSADGTVRLWDAATGTSALTLKVCEPGGNRRAGGMLSSDGKKVLTVVKPEDMEVGYWDQGSVQLHDAVTGDLSIRIPDRYVVDAMLSPDGNQIVTAGFDTAVHTWDALTGKVRFDLSGHEGRVANASFSTNGNWIVSGGWDGTARVWDAHTGRSLAVLRTTNDVLAAIFNPDATRILTVHRNQTVRLWDWAHVTGSSVAEFVGHERGIRDLAFSPDGKLLVTASADKTVRIWETVSGKCLYVLATHEDFVNGVDFSPEGKWVVTASGDRTARIWEAATGEELVELGWNESPRTCVAFSPDGKRIVTGTVDGAVPVYTCEICGPISNLVILAHTRTTRKLTAAEKEKYLSKFP
jgi:WD40 repeat protein